jgi:hypothetical protein
MLDVLLRLLLVYLELPDPLLDLLLGLLGLLDLLLELLLLLRQLLRQLLHQLLRQLLDLVLELLHLLLKSIALRRKVGKFSDLIGSLLECLLRRGKFRCGPS